jgi:hypothetical protein
MHEPTGTVRPRGGRGRWALEHPWRLAALLVAVFVVTLGCNPIQTIGYFIAPDSIVPPTCPLTIKGKDVKVLIIAAHAGPLPSDPALMRSDWDLSGKLTQILEEHYKENKERVKVIPPSQVKTYMNGHPRWRELPPQDIGKHFDADWVINLEIASISLFDRSSANFFYHGNAEIQVTVTDVHKPVGEGTVFDEPYQLEYPKSHPMERGEMSVQQFRAKFIDRLAKDLSQYFAAHPPREKYDSN